MKIKRRNKLRWKQRKRQSWQQQEQNWWRWFQSRSGAIEWCRYRRSEQITFRKGRKIKNMKIKRRNKPRWKQKRQSWQQQEQYWWRWFWARNGSIARQCYRRSVKITFRKGRKIKIKNKTKRRNKYMWKQRKRQSWW